MAMHIVKYWLRVSAWHLNSNLLNIDQFRQGLHDRSTQINCVRIEKVHFKRHNQAKNRYFYFGSLVCS